MNDSIIKIGDKTIIINGGNPLEGCPSDWDEANRIQEKLNEGKDEDEPQWNFDCGFKLDFDGSILRISSRFYPPKTHYGKTWDGTVGVFLLDKKISEKKFDCQTLDQLKTEVEAYFEKIKAGIKIEI